MRNFILLAMLWSASAYADPITAKSFLVTDSTGKVILEKNADEVMPIASITKLMTVIVVLDQEQDLDEEVKINNSLRSKYHTRLPKTVKSLSRHTLINLALVKSDNLAAYTLCQHYPGGVSSCMQAMNQKAEEMNLVNTVYVDPTGLDEGNVSTARELAQVIMLARYYSVIKDASAMAEVKIQVKRKWWQFPNTNPMVRNGEELLVSKTGYIHASGGCIAMLSVTKVGERVIIVLGSKSVRTRIPEAREISIAAISDQEQISSRYISYSHTE